MLNNSKKHVVYLDPSTLDFMFMTYTERRRYPVMAKLFQTLKDGFQENMLVTPLSLEHIAPYIEENQIDRQFLNMMGEIGQIQFLQRFTVKMLQMIRVVNNFFGQMYKKEIWKDAFSLDPDARYEPGFNKYQSITAQNTLKALDREKKLSQVFDFIDMYKKNVDVENMAADYFRYLWNQFPDVMKPYLPMDGDPEDHKKSFFDCDDLKDIPEFHIISNTLYPLFETYGIEDIEYGLKDELLIAAENTAAYMPYCHFYVTYSDIAELFLMSGINEVYGVRIYDNNESSLYQLITDMKRTIESKRSTMRKTSEKSVFSKRKPNRYFR